jgi:putative membrane protein
VAAKRQPPPTSDPATATGRTVGAALARSHHVTDHLANERTFLAWIRTAVGIIALGFVVSKFGLYLRQLAQSTHTVEPSSTHSAFVGFVLVALGVAMVIAALIRYLRSQRLIEEESYQPSRWLDIILAALVVAGGAAMFVLLVTSV